MGSGLIIEGGGMRGIFAAGVLDQLMDAEITFDTVIAVSAGACHACSFVSGQRGRAFTTSTQYLDQKEYCSLWSLRKTGNFFGADFIYHKIPEELYPIDNEAFLRSGTQFLVSATDCRTGQPAYLPVRDMFRDVEAVRASCALPLLAQMVELDGGLYMDGGIADSIPLAESIRRGNEKNLVILTRPRTYRKGPNRLMPLLRRRYRDYPGLVQALQTRHEVYNATLERIRQEEAAGRAFVIAPLGDLGLGRTEKDPVKLRKAYNEGYFVTESLCEKLRAYLAA